MRPAIFLDRDGTIVADPPPGYLNDPARVELLPDAAAAIRRWRSAGYAVVVVTNQAGIARGFISWDQYHAVAARLVQLLTAHGAGIDAAYVCPHAPEIDGECACRKPNPLLYQRAVRELELNGAESWWIGDRITDLLPAVGFGGRGVLVLTGHGPEHRETAASQGFQAARDLAAAARLTDGPP